MTMPNATDQWKKQSAPRLDGAWRPDQADTETLAANKTLTVQDNTVQRLDPDGSARTITLPAEANCKAMWFVIINAADGDAEVLTVKDDGGSTIAIADRYKCAMCYCDGTNWMGWNGSAAGANRAVLMPAGPPTLEDGTAITKYAAGGATPGWSQLDGLEVALTWDGNATPGDVSYRFLVPPDCDTGSALTLHLLGTPCGTTDSPVFSIGYTSYGAGTTAMDDSEVTGESGEFTNDTTIEERTYTLAAANIAAGPSQLDVHLHPKDGELGTDEFYLYGCWIEYVKKGLTG